MLCWLWKKLITERGLRTEIMEELDNKRSEDEILQEGIKNIAEFLDIESFQKIKNRLTDYAEIISEGKLSGIINFNYQLTSSQVNEIVDILVESGAVSRIHNLALKGKKDLEDEYVSNIFSDYLTPHNISSYISLRTTLENRLSHQLQQYNMNMAKNNTTSALSINELRGHVRTFRELSSSSIAISTKAQHGIISASLHDAYVIIMNRKDWKNDRTYMKFFFNEDDQEKSEYALVSGKPRKTLKTINTDFEKLVEDFIQLKTSKSGIAQQRPAKGGEDESHLEIESSTSRNFSDRMLATPFGQQYGTRIDEILREIFETQQETPFEEIQEAFLDQLDNFANHPELIKLDQNIKQIDVVASFLITSSLTPKTAIEKLLGGSAGAKGRRNLSSEIKDKAEGFYEVIFEVFFNHRFSSIFRIIRSLDLKKYACAYIIKRIYFLRGESINSFGFYFMKIIARVGGIKQNEG